MKRIAFYLFYDPQGIVDDYITYKLQCLREHVDTIFVVSNSPLTPDSKNKLDKVADIVHIRENIGFDVWGYKEGMETFGFEKLKEYDELILMNYTFFGPIYPFSEMFNDMDKRNTDFWGISDYAEVTPNPFTGLGTLHYHIQSHFIAIKKHMFTNVAFIDYWKNMPMINSYTESVLKHESQFTEHFANKGFTHSVYCNEKDYPSDYPIFTNVIMALKNKCPIIKRRSFFHDPLALDYEAIDTANIINFIKDNSKYDTRLIWKNLLRTVPAKDLFANIELLKVFNSDISLESSDKIIKIAVLAHVFYPEMMQEIYDYIENIPYNFDLFVTTDSENKKLEIIKFLKSKNLNSFDVLIVEKNRGRDIGAFLITCKDINLSGKYEYICRVHSKKSPQAGFNASNLFKQHMYENLLDSKAYVYNIIDFFEKNPIVGFLMPVMFHIGYPTLGHSWFCNKPGANKIAKLIGINIPFDDAVPHAAYGTMFWYRPNSLKKLFQYPWKWEDFNAEPNHTDGSLAHIIERLLVYAVHDAGYIAYNISTTKSMEKNYSKLEYKMNRIMNRLPNGDVLSQAHLLDHKILMGYYLNRLQMYLLAEHPTLSKFLKKPYRFLVFLYKRFKRKT